MAPPAITPAVGVVCHCKAKAGFRHSPLDILTRTRLLSLLRLNLDSSQKTIWFYSAAVQFPRARHPSKWSHRWVGVKGNTRNGCHDPKCFSARRFRMVREDTGAPREGATFAWMAADEAVGCTPGQRCQANGLHCEAMTVLSCPKSIPLAIPVPRPKHNTASVGFTRVNNQGERNNMQGNAKICHSRRMERNNHR
ncbi:uncharacterized protein TNCV_1586671 [Trichonephila clavipes]|nr:uncharacterized protein TNCV_1586671 [Trichonephila clavipes]